MKTFKSETSVRIASEIQSWITTSIVLSAVYLPWYLFSDKPKFESAVLYGIVFMKIGNTLSQFVVSEIHVDKGSNKITFVLKSVLSGRKTKAFPLHEIQSEVCLKGIWGRAWSSGTVLKVYTSDNGHFQITSQYGFSAKTLVKINEALNTSR